MKKTLIFAMLTLSLTVAAQTSVKTVGDVTTTNQLKIIVSGAAGGSIIFQTENYDRQIDSKAVAALNKALATLLDGAKELESQNLDITVRQHVGTVIINKGEQSRDDILFHYFLNDGKKGLLILMYFRGKSQDYFFDVAGLTQFKDLILKATSTGTAFKDQTDKFNSIIDKARLGFQS